MWEKDSSDRMTLLSEGGAMMHCKDAFAHSLHNELVAEYVGQLCSKAIATTGDLPLSFKSRGSSLNHSRRGDVKHWFLNGSG